MSHTQTIAALLRANGLPFLCLGPVYCQPIKCLTIPTTNVSILLKPEAMNQKGKF